MRYEKPPKSMRELLIRRKIQQAEDEQIVEHMRRFVKYFDETGRLPRNPSQKPTIHGKPAGRLTEREKTIRAVIREGARGVEYADYLDRKDLKTPEKWQNRGCSASYVKAFRDAYWRGMIQREKSRVRSRMNGKKSSGSPTNR
jgi:hypothetical protein